MSNSQLVDVIKDLTYASDTENTAMIRLFEEVRNILAGPAYGLNPITVDTVLANASITVPLDLYDPSVYNFVEVNKLAAALAERIQSGLRKMYKLYPNLPHSERAIIAGYEIDIEA